MQDKEIALVLLLLLSAVSTGAYFLLDGDSKESIDNSIDLGEDPLIQGEGHDHMDASMHNMSSGNIKQIEYNPLTNGGNAEVTVADSPDGRTYAYQSGWSEFHITDVTDPYNTTVTGKYTDPNTQLLDIKYLEFSGREYVILQNQLVDPGYTDPQVGEWGDPTQVSVVLVDVTDKTNPVWVDSWYDSDHPSGPHNLYTHMIDNEWYIFVANPDYEGCDIAVGEACGGVTIAHLNLQGSAARTLEGVPGAGYGHTIIKVGEYEVAWETTRGGWIYIHDMTVQTWPGTDPLDPRYGRTYVYGAYWEAGVRIGDVTDVPHPVNSPENYLLYGLGCKTTVGSPVTCLWRAPEVGYWMDFTDFDGDGQPDSGSTGNENGGRASYIHYTEPYPEMVDLSHLDSEIIGERHLITAAVEVISTNIGTGMIYIIDNTDYEIINGNLRFLPKLLGDWEIPTSGLHCFGSSCEPHANSDEWLLFSPHNLDSGHFLTDDEKPDQSYGGGWDGRLYISHYHAGLWIIDVESVIATGPSEDRNASHLSSTVAYILPQNGEYGEPLDSNFYDFGWIPFLWAAEYHKGYTYLSCITSGLYIAQLDIDIPYMEAGSSTDD